MMGCSDRAPLAAAVACALVLSASAARAAGVCGNACEQADLACNAALALCEAKIRAFDIYLAQIDTGQPKYALPPVYQDILHPHYPEVDLAKIRFAFSDQQPLDNATTDCDEIYFNDRKHVAALRNAGPNPKYHWLLHELTHPEQCAEAGGREGYAKRWWDELEAAVRASGETVNVLQPPEQLAKQLQKLSVRVHGAMPMEQAADAKAEAVLASLRRCCIAKDGTPIRPLALGAIQDRMEADGSHVFRVDARDGDPPFAATWRIKGPGDASAVEQLANRVRGLELSWTPETPGTYDVEVTVAQENPDLEPQTAALAIAVNEAAH